MLFASECPLLLQKTNPNYIRLCDFSLLWTGIRVRSTSGAMFHHGEHRLDFTHCDPGRVTPGHHSHPLSPQPPFPSRVRERESRLPAESPPRHCEWRGGL